MSSPPNRAPYGYYRRRAAVAPEDQVMTVRGDEEYRALRATIRERGTMRIGVFVAGTIAWAALVVATAALASTPVAMLLPLLMLAAVFEAVFALHIGVERIGRYVQVFHEVGSDSSDGSGGAGASDVSAAFLGWEHAAMTFGQPKGAATIDPLFCVVFLIAALFNSAPALVLQPITSELVVVGGAHLLFVLRLFVARDVARKQRAIDLARFEQIKRGAVRTRSG